MDAPLFVLRICGICSSAHAIAAVLALEDACHLSSTRNGRLLRNLIFGADILHNHLAHFYLLVLPSFVKGPEIHPFIPYPKDLRLPQPINAKLLEHYWQGLELSAGAHEMMALFGAKAPHQQTIYPTGVSTTPDAMNISAYRNILVKIKSFITDILIPDAYLLGDYYPEYYELGKSSGNFISVGMFEEKDFPGGIIYQYSDDKESLDRTKISESITYSWYNEESSGPPEKPIRSRKKKRKMPIHGLKRPDMTADLLKPGLWPVVGSRENIAGEAVLWTELLPDAWKQKNRRPDGNMAGPVGTPGSNSH